jgi:RNA polymerase sigma-70 factor, ECF subfamily
VRAGRGPGVSSLILRALSEPALQPESATPSDLELLQAIANGDEYALGVLYDRYRLILFGLLMRILSNRQEAEDVLQEVFLQVWRRARDFDQLRGRPFTWLVTLTRSRGIDRLRLLGARQRLAAAARTDQPEDISDAVKDTFLSEQRQIVNGALAELSEDQRRALMLAYFEGLTQSEIATQLDIPLGTVKTRMRSGMIKLRELLNERLKKFG